MTMTRLPLYLLLTLLLPPGPLRLLAQDLTAPLLDRSWEATLTNPALYARLEGRLTLSLPGLANELAAENVTVDELLRSESGRRILDLTRLPALLDERNRITNDLSVQTLGVGLKGDRWSAGIHHRVRSRVGVDYPRSLVRLLAEGNGAAIGQTLEVAPFGAATSYHELALGLGYRLTDELTLGARVKYLNGISDVRSRRDGRLALTTGEDNFALRLEQDYRLNSSGVITFNGLGDVDVDYDRDELSLGELLNRNSGVAYDLGLSYADDRLRLQATANDLGGRIRWTQRPTNLTFSGTSTFTGLDALRDLLNDSLSLDGALDSLDAVLSPTRTNEAYTATGGATFLLGGEYQLRERLSVGLLLRYQQRFLGDRPGAALSARYALLPWVTAGANLNYVRDFGLRLGLHTYLTPGPLRLLAATDNLFALFSGGGGSRASLRLGLSLSINRDRTNASVRNQ